MPTVSEKQTIKIGGDIQIVVEVHWWIKDIAEGIKRTVRGVDLITDENIKDFTESVYGRNTDEVINLDEIEINDIVSVMDILGDCGNDLTNQDNKSQTMFTFADVLHCQVIMPDDWGVKCIKFKKSKDSKRAFRVEK